MKTTTCRWHPTSPTRTTRAQPRGRSGCQVTTATATSLCLDLTRKTPRRAAAAVAAAAAGRAPGATTPPHPTRMGGSTTLSPTRAPSSRPSSSTASCWTSATSFETPTRSSPWRRSICTPRTGSRCPARPSRTSWRTCSPSCGGCACPPTSSTRPTRRRARWRRAPRGGARSRAPSGARATSRVRRSRSRASTRSSTTCSSGAPRRVAAGVYTKSCQRDVLFLVVAKSLNPAQADAIRGVKLISLAPIQYDDQEAAVRFPIA